MASNLASFEAQLADRFAAFEQKLESRVESELEKARAERASAAASAEVNSAVAEPADLNDVKPVYIANPDAELPNAGIDYLGMGYDYAYGNPIGDPITQIDPGFKAPVAKLRYSDDGDISRYMTRDEAYLAPLGGYTYPEFSCYLASSAKEASTTKDYSSNLATDCHVSASVSAEFGGYGGGAGFHYSNAAKQFASEVASTNSKSFSMTSYCLQYVAAFDYGPTTTIEGEPDFCEQAGYLPRIDIPVTNITADDITLEHRKAWHDHFRLFGTHYIHLVHMGGKMVHTMTFSEDAVTKIKEAGLDMKAGVEASLNAGVVSASASAESSKSSSEKAKDAVANSNYESKTMVFGGLPPEADPQAPEAFGMWAESVKERPMPVRYELTPNSAFACMDTNTYNIMFSDYMKNGAYNDVALGKMPGGVGGGLVNGGKLRIGETMTEGQKICSPNGETCLKLEHDGKLVLVNNVYTPVTLMNTRQLYCEGGCEFHSTMFVDDGSGGKNITDPEFLVYFATEDQGRRGELRIGMNPYPEECRCSNTRDGPKCEYLPDIAAATLSASTESAGAKTKKKKADPAESGVDKCRFTVAWTNDMMGCKDSMVAALSVQDAGNIVITTETGKTIWYSGTSAKSGAGIMRPAKAVLPPLPDLWVSIFSDADYKGPEDKMGPGCYASINTDQDNFYTKQKMTLCNDCISSIKVPRGLVATLFDDTNYGRNHYAYIPGQEIPDLQADWIQFNDATSSMCVDRDPNVQFGPSSVDKGYFTDVCKK